MCVSAAVSSGLHIHADCVRTFNPFLGTQSERMQPGFALKVVEFDHFEIGVIHDSQVPRNSKVERALSQFLMTSAARPASVRAFAISVRRI